MKEAHPIVIIMGASVSAILTVAPLQKPRPYRGDGCLKPIKPSAAYSNHHFEQYIQEAEILTNKHKGTTCIIKRSLCRVKTVAKIVPKHIIIRSDSGRISPHLGLTLNEPETIIYEACLDIKQRT